MDFKMLAVLVLTLIALSALRSASSSSLSHNLHFRGIAPQDEKYYRNSDLIKCRDGSKKFSKAQLNDDFCDCSDGTDEPGTSACPNGRFYCRNAGHSPKLLFSSRVNDGICDCCDGSDEYNDTAKCANTCWEAGKVARDKLKKKISTYLEGVTIRKKDIERAKADMAKDEAELLKLQSEAKTLKGLVQELREHKEQIEKAEEKERLQKEKERKEAEEKNKEEAAKASHENGEEVEKSHGKDEATESINDDKLGTLDDSASDQNTVEAGDDLFDDHGLADTSKSEESSNQDVEKEKEKEKEEPSTIPETGVNTGSSKDSPDEVINTGNGPSENTGDLSREELGRLVASRWTGENTEKKAEDVNGEKDDTHEHDNGEVPKDTHEDEEDGYASETDDDQHKYDEDTIEDEAYEDFKDENHDDFKEENHDDSSSYKYDSDTEYESDTVNSDNPSFLEKIQQKIRHILQAVNLFQTPVNQSDAARVRKEFDDSTTKLSKMQSRISSLTQKLKQDFGVDKEFYSFYDKCFEGKENKYVYKVCPYKQASQEEGHSTTRLGRWDKFDDAYRSMVFSNGDKCWNGPDRSLKVKLRCGLKNEVTDVDEPSRCEYVAILSTPALCLEEKLKELQQKLDGMNKEQPENHDEL